MRSLVGKDVLFRRACYARRHFPLSTSSCWQQRSSSVLPLSSAAIRLTMAQQREVLSLKQQRCALLTAAGRSNTIIIRWLSSTTENSWETASPPAKKTKKRRLTLDEFFEDLGKQQQQQTDQPKTKMRSSSPNKRSLRPPPSRVPSGTGLSARAEKDNDESSASSTSRTDMASFFDQVDAIVAKNKRLKEEIGKTSTPFLFSNATASSSRSSLFEVPPPSSSSKTTKTYDNTPRGKYLELLDSAMDDRKFLRKHTKSPLSDEDAAPIVEWLQSTEPSIETRLGMLQKALFEGEDDDTVASPSHDQEEEATKEINNKIRFRNELRQQCERFLNHHGWTKKQYDVAINGLVRLGSLCAKHATAPPLEMAWQKLKEAGYSMDQDVLHNYLYVSSTYALPSARRLSSLSTRFSKNSTTGSVLDFLDGLSSGNESSLLSGQRANEEEEMKNDAIDVAAEVALCHDFLFEPSEQTTMIHVKVLVSQGRPNEAEKLLDASQKSDELRLRTYTPVFDSYLDLGDVTSAFKLFVKMKQGEHVRLQPETYAQLMACVAKNGYFRVGAESIPEIAQLGYTKDSGPELFDMLASELSSNSVEISSASAKLLYNAFQRGFECENPAYNLKPMNLFESFQINDDPAKANELIVSRVRIDETTGRCTRSGSKLRLIGLGEDQKQQFKNGLMHLNAVSYEERSKMKDSERVVKDLRQFGDWLQGSKDKPFTAIIDGPNVGYYMQNFDQGRFNYHQIKFVMDALEEMGENVLVVLPQRYMQDSFTIQVGGRRRQRLRKDEKEIREDLISKGKVCVVPMGLLDDYYWMYASVSVNEEYVSPGNAEQRWPGIRPMLISNDKLRDHAMSLLEPRLFRRWFSNFMVNFTFSAFVDDKCADREIGFRPADFYSREIQGNLVPTVQGDSSASSQATAWHFPVADWDSKECLCIRIPKE